MNVTAQSGAWLALLRTATNNTVKNTCVHLEGEEAVVYPGTGSKTKAQ